METAFEKVHYCSVCDGTAYKDKDVLVVGGGIGTPERGADYITGEWATEYGRPLMPVDGVLVGTAAMTAKEAHTSPKSSRCSSTPRAFRSRRRQRSVRPTGRAVGAVRPGQGGVTSGLSHLHADIYELENSSAPLRPPAGARHEAPGGAGKPSREIIAALNATAKPYFGDLKTMTYLEWAQRFADLSFPWVDETYADRFLHLLQRIEARVTTQESGEFASLFASRADVEADPNAAIAKLAETYPQAGKLTVTPMDEAWFPVLVREYPKPMPFVPVIDNDLLRWWGQDQLWQSEDSRYSADSVRIIPGPISVAGITTVDEPVADILGRFEAAMVKRVSAESASADKTAFAQLGAAVSAEEFIRKSPNISWSATSWPTRRTAPPTATQL